MQEDSLSKTGEETGSDVIGLPNGQLKCNSARPWPVRVALCLSAVLPVLFVAFAVFTLFNVCSGNGIIYDPFVTVPLFAAVILVPVLSRIVPAILLVLPSARRWFKHVLADGA